MGGVSTRAMSAAWRDNLLTNRPGPALEIARSAKRVAVLGIKTEGQASQPAFYVPEYLKHSGVKVIPVPVYFPEVTEILGEPVFRKVSDIKGEQIDIVDIFRRPKDLEQHLEDILACDPLPRAVWLQSGITHPIFEEALAKAGIKVVSDRCLLVDRRDAIS